MAWYDWFAGFYDSALDRLYMQAREQAIAALDLRPGLSVLDVPCGTGASLELLARAVGDDGQVLGVDLSAGMLRRAQRRAAASGLHHVQLLNASATELDAAAVQGSVGCGQVDRLHVFLGMSVFSDMQAAFAALWDTLAPGGRCVIVDVHADPLGFQGRMVNMMAQADIRRRFWEPLAAVGDGFEHYGLTHNPKHGGQISLALATKHVD